MDDYYAIAGVSRSASAEVIERAIREQLRRWQRRTAGPDLARRQEAEWRVQQLGQARSVLLDEQRRQQYDRELDTDRPAPSPALGDKLEYRLRPAHRANRLVVTGVLLLASAFWFAAGVPVVGVISIFAAAFSAVVFIALRDHGVVLSPEGITVRGNAVKKYGWAEVRAIEATEVDGKLRVEICTVDGIRMRTPAPRGEPPPYDDRDFADKLAAMRRWLDHYGPEA